MADPESLGGPQAPVDPIATYSSDLDAAEKDLQAVRSDLEQLLSYIDLDQVSRRQVPALLRLAHGRLSTLRGARPEALIPASGAAGVSGPLRQAASALEPGTGFSLEAAEEAFGTAYDACCALDGAAELAASLRAAQGRLAAAAQDYRRAAERLAEAAATPGLPVGAQWAYQSERAALLEDLGREFGDHTALEQAIALYRDTVLGLAPRAERPDDWAATQNRLGTALGVLGQRQRGTWMLERAIEAFGQALAERDRERVPLQWAETQNNLGNALGSLALRQSDTEMLEQAVAAFERALEVRTLEESPQAWATTQNNLGAALLTLGQRNKDAKRLARAVEAYKRALQVWTRDRVPLDWATTMNNLGTALRALGEQRKGPRTLEQAVAAYRSALAERTRERLPEDWAMTQNNLGAALHKLAERQEDAAPTLIEAVAAYENALVEWRRERTPVAWAMTTANLGVARRMLAEQARDLELSRQAEAEFEAVAEVFREASHAQYYELAEERVAETRKLIASLGG